MSKVSIKICATLHTILQDENCNNFQVVELRDAFLAVSPSNQSASEAYKFIYRQVNKLIKKGVLKKAISENSKTATYQKTEQFDQVSFIISQRSEDASQPIEYNVTRQLKDRLKQSEVDLLTSIGESEEYMRLYQSFPEMKAHLESQYMLARENSSKLLGQVKAIKSVLAHQKK
ncbi:response regulator [Shewanella colwelliana]|uniref:Response regulator n=1 Tax=Shewanella colwelliana TaxID=23 RepID=A0A1E5IYN2_SHECO|nr:response regulator [Shewanella colwelliana]OEG75639.1 response regulator [Shewanella colwelliana]